MSGRGKRLPWWKKAAFALVVTVAFFVLLEGALAVFGVRPVVDTRDPFVGFSAHLPLFVEDDDGMMTTATNKLAYFNHQSFPRAKPPNTYRIFCLGGSTTYGRPYRDKTSFPGWLREFLPAADPSRKWEVINAGGISYASYRVAHLMDELAQLAPDLFIVYTGHNEFLENRTYADIREMSAAQIELTAALSRTRTYSLVHKFLAPKPQSTTKAKLPGEVNAMLDNTVGPADYKRDDKLAEQILSHFEFNLARMVAIARQAGAKIIFITPASNMKDFSPFKSDNSIDARDAERHFRSGQELLQAERYAEAHAAFERAINEDICPLRALTEIPKRMHRIAEKLNVPIVDFESSLQNRCVREHGHNCPGSEYFLDHVHPDVATNRFIAQLIVDQLVRLNLLDPTEDWDQSKIDRLAKQVESKVNEQDHADALRNLAKVLNWAGKHTEAGPLAIKALQTLPNDPECLFLSAVYFKSIGKTKQAIDHFRKTLENKPDYAEAHQLLGATLVDERQLAEALVHFKQLVELTPNDADAHHMVGAVLVELNRPKEAIPYFRTAIKRKPNNANIHYNFARALNELGRRDEAIQEYRRTIELDPNDADARHNLNVLLQSAR